VPEEFALEERFGNRGAIRRNEAPIFTAAEPVQRTRYQFLARPGFAGDQRRAHVWRQPADRVEQLLHDRASPDHAVELELAGELAVGHQQPLPAGKAVAHGVEQPLQAIPIERLTEVIQRAKLDGFDRRVHRRMGGHQDHVAGRMGLAYRAKQIQPTDLGHAQIDERDIGLQMWKLREERQSAGARDDVEALILDEPFNQPDHARIVVDDQQDGLGELRHRGCVCRFNLHPSSTTFDRVEHDSIHKFVRGQPVGRTR
jgi:hypothetical protein